MTTNRRFLLTRRPRGPPVPEDFSLVQVPVPQPTPGTFVVRNRFVSLDPAQRGWMDDAPSYMPPIALGDPVRATTVGQVHSSASPDFSSGDWVMGLNGIEEYSIAAAAPQGIDIVFENVGGDVLDAALMNLAPKARVILCGLISEYNSDVGKVGARNLWQVIVKRAIMQGFLIMDYVPQFAAGGAQIARWLAEGRMRIDEDIVDGIENAYGAFMKLFSGDNQGKLILRLP